MPKALHRFGAGIWRAIIGADINPAPPPTVTVPPVLVGFGSFYANAGAITMSLPPGYQFNDVALGYIETAAQALGALPAGYAHVTGSPFSTGTAAAAGSVGLAHIWKRLGAAGTEGGVGVGDSGDHQIGRLTVWRGCVSTGNPWNAIASDVLGAAAATVFSIPGLTTTVDNCTCVACVANATDNSTDQTSFDPNTHLTGFAEFADANTAQGVGGGFGLGYGTKLLKGSVAAVTGSLLTSSKQARVLIALAPEPTTGPPPSTSGIRTFVGSSGLDKTLWGLDPTPDFVNTNSNGTTAGTVTTGTIDSLVSTGAHAFIRFAGGNTENMDVNGFYSSDAFKAKVDAWVAAGRAASATFDTRLQAAVASGNLRGWYAFDDFESSIGDNAFARAVTYLEIEDACAYIKSIYPWMPCFCRGTTDYLKATATQNGVVRRYRWLDCVGVQYRFRNNLDGTPEAYFARHVATAESIGLSVAGHANLLNEGTGCSGGAGCLDPGWGCRVAGRTDRCGMGPNEVRAVGFAALANPKIVGIDYWAYNFGIPYWSLAEIQAALQDVRNRSIGRNDPPINIRGDLPSAA